MINISAFFSLRVFHPAFRLFNPSLHRHKYY
jgi:hypothetical protein